MLYGKKINAVPRTKTPEQALAALMRLCARAEKSEGDARRLMRGWGVAEKDAEQVLGRLVRDRFIDDSRYAEARRVLDSMNARNARWYYLLSLIHI